MHMTRLPQARRIFPALALVAGLLLLAGCNLTITNLTSDVLRENPSQLIYQVPDQGVEVAK